MPTNPGNGARAKPCPHNCRDGRPAKGPWPAYFGGTDAGERPGGEPHPASARQASGTKSVRRATCAAAGRAPEGPFLGPAAKAAAQAPGFFDAMG